MREIWRALLYGATWTLAGIGLIVVITVLGLVVSGLHVQVMIK